MTDTIGPESKRWPDVAYWPTASVASHRPERKLPEGKLPTTGNVIKISAV